MNHRKQKIKRMVEQALINEGIWDFVKNTVNSGVGAVENLLGKNNPDIRAQPAGSRINIPGVNEPDVHVDPSLPPETRKQAYWNAIGRRNAFRAATGNNPGGQINLERPVPYRIGPFAAEDAGRVGRPLTADPRSTPGNVQDVTPQTRQQIDAERHKEAQRQGGNLMANTQSKIAADKKRQQDTIAAQNARIAEMDAAIERGDVEYFNRLNNQQK